MTRFLRCVACIVGLGGGATWGLAATPADQDFDAIAISSDTGGNSFVAGSFTFLKNGSNHIAIADGPSGISAFMSSTGADHFIVYDGVGTGGVTQNEFSTTDGSDFRVVGMTIDTGLALDRVYTIRGFRDGGQVHTATLDLTNSGSNGGIAFTKTGLFDGQGTLVFTGWNAVDRIVFTASDLDTMLDDIDVSAVGVPPSATVVVADTALTVGETSLVTFTFSEAVTGFSNPDLSIANGSLTAVSSGDGGITWTATFTPTASITDATNVITVDMTGLTSVSTSTAGAGTQNSNNYAIDTLRPTAALVVADTALTVGETALVTITFSEAVTGFTNADLTIANGTLSAVSSSDGGITWTATFTPTASITDATNLITLANTGVSDAAGNAGTGTTNSNNYAIDTARPAATVVVADNALAAGETSLVTITFSEAVTGFTNADLTVASGTLSAVSSSDGGITWTATLTPTAGLTDATNVITLANTGVTDAAGNAGTGTTDSNNYAIDTVRPTATLVVADNALAVGETSLVTITFSEAVTGFTSADLTIANGTLSAVNSGDGGITWTATFTPTASIADATNVITLANTGVQDAAGNPGTGTTDSNNYAIDGIRPTATIVVADAALAAGETSLVTFTFSEAVTGFTNADLTVANGTLSSVSSSDGGITWTATLTPTAGLTDATNVITLADTGVTDAAGNTGTGTTDSNNYAIDTARPTAAIVVADSVLAAGETSLVTFTFSEAVTGFSNADVSVPNGTLSAVGSSDGGTTWAATFTPTAGTTDSTNVITLANTGVADAAGNTGTGTIDSNNFVIDNVAPGAPSTPDLATASDSGNSSADDLTNNTAPIFIGTAPAGSTVELFRAGSIALGTTTADGSGAWSLGYTGTALPEGSHTFTATARDAVGNTSPASSGLVITIDTTAPVITSAGSASGTYNVSFSYAVTATGSATSFGATGLPAGLSIGTTSGAIAGTPTEAGVFNATIRATDMAGNEASTALALTIAKADQTITFTPPADKLISDAGFALSATASSGLTVTFTISSGPATVSGNTITLTGAPGTVTVVAQQAGNAAYAAAPDVTRTLAVTSPAPVTGFGLVTGGSQNRGNFGAQLAVDGRSGVLIGFLPGAGGFVVNFLPDGNGAFVATTPALSTAGAAVTWTFRGQIQGNTLTGSIDELTYVFAGAFDPIAGSTAAIAGYYVSPALDTTTGQIHTIIGTTGKVYVLTVLPDLVTGDAGTADGSTGDYHVSAGSGVTIDGNAQAAAVDGTVVRSGGATTDFAGPRAGAARTDRLINLSSRARVGSGASVVITGFVIGGTLPKQVLLRAVGPGLNGYQVRGALVDPRLTLMHDGAVFAVNDDWGAAANVVDISAAMLRTGAFNLGATSKDSALLVTLPPGIYTAIIEGVGGPGVALAELYDASPTPATDFQRLVNISTRGFVGVGDDTLIGGFVITGNTPKRVLVRGIGPRLASYGVTGTLADPRLTIFQGATAIAQNNDWGTGSNSAVELTAAATATGAFALDAGSKDAAILITLAPGLYTAHVTSVNGATGIALVEAYEAP